MTVEHIDGAKAAVKTVELQKSDAASGSVVDLVKEWMVPEHEHLPVADVELLVNGIVAKVSRGVQVGEKLADVGNQLVVRVRLSRSRPTVRQGDHEDALLSHWTPVCRSWWERIPGRNEEGITCASRLGELLLKPRAPDEADGGLLPSQHAQPGQLLKVAVGVHHLPLVHIVGGRGGDEARCGSPSLECVARGQGGKGNAVVCALVLVETPPEQALDVLNGNFVVRDIPRGGHQAHTNLHALD